MAIDFESINRSIDILALTGLQGKRAAARTNGGEYKTSCPYCGGKDRAAIWPKHEHGPRGWCRVCNRSFDGIDLYMVMHNLDRGAAIAELTSGATRPQTSRSNGNQSESALDLEKWNAAADRFITSCHNALFEPANRKALDWLLQVRGLSYQSIITAELGYNPGDHKEPGGDWGFSDNSEVFLPRGITIPNRGHGINIRKPTKARNKYHKVLGSHGFIYCANKDLEDRHIGYLFESELDAILANSLGYHAAFFSLPAGQYLDKPEYTAILANIDYLILCMDQDEAGRAATEKHLQIESTIAADPLPKEAKDLTDYYQVTDQDLDALLTWILDQADKLPEGEQWTTR